MSNLFLKNSIIEPNVDIPPPKPFLFCRWLLFNSSLIDLPDSVDIFSSFFQKDQIYPSIIIETILSDLILIEIPSFTQNNSINFLLSSMFLLKIDVNFIKFLCFIFWNMPKTELKYLSCPVVLPLLDFKLSELNEVVFMKSINSKLCYYTLKYLSSSFLIPVPDLKFSHLEICAQLRESFKVLVENSLGFLRLTISFFKLRDTQ